MTTPPEDVVTHPTFWVHPPLDVGDTSKFENNALWIREAAKGFAETLNQEDWIMLYQLARGVAKFILDIDLDKVGGLNEAFEQGWKLGRTLLKGVKY